jgi:hypothetical protein
MAGGKISPTMGSVSVGSSSGAAQAPTVLRKQAATIKSKWPSKAGRYGVTMVEEGKKEKRAT